MRDQNSRLINKPTALSASKTTKGLTKGTPFNAVVDNKVQRSVPWYDENGKLHHLSNVGTPYIKDSSGLCE